MFVNEKKYYIFDSAFLQIVWHSEAFRDAAFATGVLDSVGKLFKTTKCVLLRDKWYQ